MTHNPYTPPKANVEDVSAAGTVAGEPPLSAPLYTPNQIAIASFLGSPIAAAWFAARNYRALAQPDKAKSTLLWGIVASVVVFGISVVLPDRVPNAILPIAYSLAIRYMADSTFGNMISSHVRAGGARGSSWRVVGISLLFGVGVFAIAFAIGMALVQIGALSV